MKKKKILIILHKNMIYLQTKLEYFCFLVYIQKPGPWERFLDCGLRVLSRGGGGRGGGGGLRHIFFSRPQNFWVTPSTPVSQGPHRSKSNCNENQVFLALLNNILIFIILYRL